MLLDALCGKDSQSQPIEWIKEEELAESVHLHIKLVRKALRYLEQVCLLNTASGSCLQAAHCHASCTPYCTLPAHGQSHDCELGECQHEHADIIGYMLEQFCNQKSGPAVKGCYVCVRSKS